MMMRRRRKSDNPTKVDKVTADWHVRSGLTGRARVAADREIARGMVEELRSQSKRGSTEATVRDVASAVRRRAR
jgi:hypothetical protein